MELKGHHKENPLGTTQQLHTLSEAALTSLRRKKNKRGRAKSVLLRHSLYLC